MPATACLPDPVLRALAVGELTDEQAAPWESHLLSCPECLARVRSFQTADTLVEALHAGRTVELSTPDATVLNQLIERLADRFPADPAAASAGSEEPTRAHQSDAHTATASTKTDAAPSGPGVGVGGSLGPYRLLAKLGEGGMGAVYKAQHEHLDKTVALKLLPPQVTQHPDSVARFKREMKAVGKLNHPNIVQAHDAGEINGVPYLAMEYVEGTDLQKLVKDRGPLSVVSACIAVRQAAQALAAAHAAGLVHRDIKPANLLLAKSGQVKVLDMGLALLASDAQENHDLTTAGQTFGTPDYMAPEQWSDAHAADARTDLYALGCTLFYLLVGRAPYADEKHRTSVAKMTAHVVEPIPDLAAARNDVPAGVAEIYKKLLAKEPADRFQTAAELAAALAPYSSSKALPPGSSPVAPRQESSAAKNIPTSSRATVEISAPAPQTSRGARGLHSRNRMLALAAAGAAAVILAGVIIITITNKDGTKTTLRVPEGTETDIQTAPGSKLSISQTNSTGSATGWPADAPKPAIAPFNAAQAKQHQDEWAAYGGGSISRLLPGARRRQDRNPHSRRVPQAPAVKLQVNRHAGFFANFASWR